MIIKGKSRAGAQQLAKHLGNAEKNENVKLLETRGTVAQDLRGALVEMDAYAAGTRCEKPLYHAAMSPEPPHRLTDEQRAYAIDALEEKLGLTGHARVVVMHEKLGREHIHVVWSRIDLEKMRSVSDSHNYRKHEEVARQLERHFGHDRVQGAHHERDGIERPERTPSRAELQQQERTGITGKMVKEEVTMAFRTSDGPEAFRAALEERGYVLARGDRRDHVIIDPLGGVHSLARRIDGMKVAELREFMAPIDKASLPSIEEAREIAADRERRARELLAAEQRDAAIEKAYQRGDDYVSQTTAAQKDHERRMEALQQPKRTEQTKGAQEEIAMSADRKNVESDDEHEHDRRPANAPEMGDYAPPVKDREPNRYRDLEIDPAEKERSDHLPPAKGTDPVPHQAPEMDEYSSPVRSREPNRYDGIDMRKAEQAPPAVESDLATSKREETPEQLKQRDESNLRPAPIEIDLDALRQKEILDQSDRDRRQAREEVTERGDSSARARGTSPSDNSEMTDAKRERIDRLLNSGDEGGRDHDHDDWPPDRQPEAPGGGRTRSR